MLLNRPYFSLASLVVSLTMIFTVSVTAHDGHSNDPGHPVVTISEAPASAYTTGQPKARNNFKIQIAATVNGSTDAALFEDHELAAADVTVITFTADGRPGIITDTPVTRTDATKAEWILTLDLSSNTAVRSLRVVVTPDTFDGNRRGALGGNELTIQNLSSLPPVLALSAALEVAQKKVGSTDIPGRFTLTVTFQNADGTAVTSDPIPAPTIDDIVVTPEGNANAVNDVGAIVPTGTPLAVGTVNDGIYTQDYQLTFGVAKATLSLISGYATNTPSATFPPVTQESPSVAIAVSELDENARSFRLDITLTPGIKSDGSAGDPVEVVTRSDSKANDPKVFSFQKLTATDKDNYEVIFTVEAERAAPNTYEAVLRYDFFSVLPLTLTTIDAFETSDDPRTSVIVRVGASIITFSPDQIPTQTFVRGTPITPVYLPVATGGTSPYTYTLSPLPAGLVFNSGVQQLSGTPTAIGTTIATYTARDAVNNTGSLTFTITVLATPPPSVITDNNLAAAIRRSLSLPANAPLTAAVLAQLTQLDGYNSQITQLNGLEQATNLTTLDLGMNQITNISALANLTKLTHLYLDDNQITDVNPLVGLRNLRLLRLARNPIQNTAPLATLIQQNPGLDLDVPPISPQDDSVTFVDPDLETAVRTALRMTASETITKESMLQLFFLEAYDRRIASIQGLEHATNLIALDLGKNAIVDISPLSGLTQLQILFLDDNQIADVSPLAGLTQLDLLFLSGNPISSLAPISHLIDDIQILRTKIEQ